MSAATNTSPAWAAATISASHGAKNVLCVNTLPGATNTEDRCKGIADGIAKSGGKSSQLPLPSSSFGNPTAVAEAIKAALLKDNTIDGVITISAGDANSAANAISQASVGDKVKLGSFDMDETGLQRIKDGTQMFAIDQQPYLQGFLAVSLLNGFVNYGLDLPTKPVLTGPGIVDARPMSTRRWPAPRPARAELHSWCPALCDAAGHRRPGAVRRKAAHRLDVQVSTPGTLHEIPTHRPTRRSSDRRRPPRPLRCPRSAASCADPRSGSLIGLVAVFVFFSIFGGANFLSAGGAASWLNVASELGIIALPVGLLMIAGQLDLSVGSMLPASSMTVAIVSGHYRRADHRRHPRGARPRPRSSASSTGCSSSGRRCRPSSSRWRRSSRVAGLTLGLSVILTGSTSVALKSAPVGQAAARRLHRRQVPGDALLVDRRRR